MLSILVRQLAIFNSFPDVVLEFIGMTDVASMCRIVVGNQITHQFFSKPIIRTHAERNDSAKARFEVLSPLDLEILPNTIPPHIPSRSCLLLLLDA
jgi:hypothetical protein